MATCADEFEEWLCTKLKALNTDQDVFATYIRGILEGDEPNDDKLEALEGILFEIETDSMVTLSQEILDKWDMLSHVKKDNVPLKLDIDAQLASIMEKQAQSVVIERKLTDEERRYREAILAQYSHVSDNEDDDDDEANPNKEASVTAVSVATASAAAATTAAAATPSSVPVNGYQSLSKNTNAEDVFKAEKDKRDKAKAESEKKKAGDKANREKQKQQQQERKEKEKKRTQKGERKR